MSATFARRVLLMLASTAGSAFAAQAPDSPLVTGPNFQQVPSNQIMVTPNGKSQMTLGAALAAGGGSGTVTPSPQYGIGIFPNAGTNAVVAGSSAITTDGSGNLNVAGATTTAGVSDSGGINTTSVYSINSGEVLNLFANEPSPILPGPGQNTVVATSSYFNRPQVIGHADTITSATASTYAGSRTGNLTIVGTMANHWGEDIDQINVQPNGGTITGELNVRNVSLNIGANSTMHHGGALEAQFQNSGTVLSAVNGFYTSFQNSPTGVIANPAIAYGFNDIWINNNTTAGALWQHVAFHCNPMAGSGAAPTFEHCLRNDDPNGLITTLGRTNFGSVADPGSATQVKITSTSTLSSQFPLQISSAAVTNIVLVHASGGVDMLGAPLTLGIDGSKTGNVIAYSSTAGNFIQLNGGPAGVGGAFLSIAGTLPTGTPTSSACFTSAGILISNAGCGALPSTQLNNAVTVSTLPTCNTAARGTTQMVSDATTPAYNTTLVGSGSSYVKAFCNGSNWVGG